MIDLPPEIIEIIFLTLCSPKTIFPLRGDPRLLVTHVCSQWRAIALATPSLWANIHIPLNFPPPYDHVRTWISRSAQSPLSVGSYGPTHHSTPTADIFDLIIPVIQRCVSLRLFLDRLTFKRLLALPPGSLYTLQGISINLAHTGRYGMIHFLPHRVTALERSPSATTPCFF
ncbi:hypothetical protein BD779DRAFT_1675654 [Infundibulicybe gibba]|nr:hypothetical protein BD779DRAFT_1675654 [Infundibulicybe gibba]